jgi:hypothetical protein
MFASSYGPIFSRFWARKATKIGSRGLSEQKVRAEGDFSPVFQRFLEIFALNRLFLHVLDFFESWAAVGAPAIGKIAALFRAGVINTAAVVSAEEFASAVRGFFQG